LGTNKLSSCIGTVASTVRYVKNGYADWLLAIPSIVLAMMGAFLGTKLQLAVNEQYLKLVLLVILPVIAVILLKKKNLNGSKLILGNCFNRCKNYSEIWFHSIQMKKF
jgi:uncharacterized membrane protein YfcA